MSEVEQKPAGNGMVKTAAVSIGGCALLIVAAVYCLKTGVISIDPNKPVEEAPIVAPAPIYVTIAPFTVNIQSPRPMGGFTKNLIYSGLSFRVEDNETADFLRTHMPELRSRLLMIMADQDPEVLRTREGKDKLKETIMNMLKEPFTKPQPVLKVTDLLFNEFVIQ